MGNQIASVPLGWVIVPASLVGAAATFAVGANDVGNALGTSLGSKALSLRSAIVLGAVMEFAGILALGSLVGSTLRTGVVNPEFFLDPQYFVIGMFSVLCAATSWLLAATLLGLPVSTTHTIVAGIFAFGAFEEGFASINSSSMIGICISWVVSPLAGFVVSFGFYFLLHKLIVERNQHDSAGLTRCAERLFPLAAGLTLGFMALLVCVAIWKNTFIHFWILPVVSLSVGVITWALTVWLFLPQWKARKVACGRFAHRVMNWGDPYAAENFPSDTATVDTEDEIHQARSSSSRDLIVSSLQTQNEALFEAERLFVSLMVITAGLVAFAHSANDIANSVAPFLICFEWFTAQTIDPLYRGPMWIYMIAGLCLVLGLVCLGFLVMRTIGEKVTKLNPMAGFSAQLSASIVVIVATLIGLPISTTHVIVGAVVGVGAVSGVREIQWRTLIKIVLGWLLTLLIGACLTLCFYAPLRLTVVLNITTNKTLIR